MEQLAFSGQSLASNGDCAIAAVVPDCCSPGLLCCYGLKPREGANNPRPRFGVTYDNFTGKRNEIDFTPARGH